MKDSLTYEQALVLAKVNNKLSEFKKDIYIELKYNWEEVYSDYKMLEPEENFPNIYKRVKLYLIICEKHDEVDLKSYVKNPLEFIRKTQAAIYNNNVNVFNTPEISEEKYIKANLHILNSMGYIIEHVNQYYREFNAYKKLIKSKKRQRENLMSVFAQCQL